MNRIEIAPTASIEYHEELPTIKITRNVVLISIIVSFSGVTFGIENYLLVVLMTTNFKQNMQITFRSSEVLSSILPGGAFLASLIVASLNDNYGRRFVIFFSCIVLIIGDAICVTTSQLYTFIAGRLVTGFSIGKKYLRFNNFVLYSLLKH